MGQNDARIRVSAEVSGLKLAEDCELSADVTKAVLKKMREENLSFKKAMESFFGSVQHDKKGSVVNKSQKNNIPVSKYQSWTQKEVDLLILNAPKGYKECEKILTNRTYTAIVSKGKKLGLSLGVDRNGRVWTEKEVDILIEYFDRMTAVELGSILGRKPEAIHKKLYSLRH